MVVQFAVTKTDDISIVQMINYRATLSKLQIVIDLNIDGQFSWQQKGHIYQWIQEYLYVEDW